MHDNVLDTISTQLDWFLVPFWRPLDFEWVPQSTFFWNVLKTNQKKDLRRRFEQIYFSDWYLMPKWEAWNCKKEVFALYLLQIKRFRWSEKLIENWGPNGIKKASKLKPLASSKVWVFEILMDFGKLVFYYIFLGRQQAGPPNLKIRFWAARNRGTRSKGGDLAECHYSGWTTKLRFWLF